MSPGRCCQTHGPSTVQAKREYHACVSSVNKYKVYLARDRASSSTAAHSAVPIPRRRKCEPTNTPPSQGVRSSRPSRSCTRKGGGSKKLSIRMRNPCNRQLISIHVRLQFFDSSLRGFFAKNRAPLFEEPLRQLRDVFGVLNQVVNLNSAHTNSVFDLTRIVPNYSAFRKRNRFDSSPTISAKPVGVGAA